MRLMNRFRKTGTYIRPDSSFGGVDSDLLAAPEARGRGGFFDEPPPDYGQEDYGGENNEDYEGGEEEALIDPETELANLERVKEMVELNKFQDFYNTLFTQRMLNMVNLISSVSTKNAFASHILFSIAHPERIGTLISILALGNPALKILAIKILEHLTLVLPPELFEESVNYITTGANERSFQAQILGKIKATSKIGNSNKFTKLLFNYLLSIRNKIWARKFESQGMYGVSNAIVNLLRKMFETTVWRYLHESELKQSVHLITKLSFQEKDVILSLFGGDLQGLSAGNIAFDKNENKITLLGFADQWIEDQED